MKLSGSERGVVQLPAVAAKGPVHFDPEVKVLQSCRALQSQAQKVLVFRTYHAAEPERVEASDRRLRRDDGTAQAEADIAQVSQELLWQADGVSLQVVRQP